MPTTYTNLLGLALPASGELQGTWGTTVNNYITQYIDAAIAGALTISTDADATLTKTTGSSLGSTSSQYQIIRWTASNGATLRTITVPAASKTYVIINDGTGSIKIVGAGPTTGVTVAAGEDCLIAWNGSDFVKIANLNGVASFSSLTVDTDVLVVDATNNRVGINTAAPGATLHLTTSGGVTGAVRLEGTSSTGSSFPRFNINRTSSASRATEFIGAYNMLTTLTDASTSQVGFLAFGSNVAATNYQNIQAQVNRAFVITSQTPSVVGNNATAYTSTSTDDVFVADKTQVAAVQGKKLGYGTTSGGTVTQVTSRTTGVTLNKVCGAITLVSAAGSSTFQSFTVTNSTVAAEDVVIVSQKSGTDLYRLHVTNVAAGSFRITFATTGGTTTEQPVFNFAVIKAVTA